MAIRIDIKAIFYYLITSINPFVSYFSISNGNTNHNRILLIVSALNEFSFCEANEALPLNQLIIN